MRLMFLLPTELYSGDLSDGLNSHYPCCHLHTIHFHPIFYWLESRYKKVGNKMAIIGFLEVLLDHQHGEGCLTVIQPLHVGNVLQDRIRTTE